MSKNEHDLLAMLSRRPGGSIDHLPKASTYTPREVEELVDRLVRLGYLRIWGPPNQNSFFGKDLETMTITAAGRAAVR